jgi:hypothetical protein
MRAWCDRGIWRVVRGSELTGAETSSLRTSGGDRIGSTRGFRAGRSAEGTGSETDGPTGCRFGVKSASAAWRARVIRSRSPRGWCCCCRLLSKGRPDCLVARGSRRRQNAGIAVIYARILHQKFAPKNFNPLKGLGFDPNILIFAHNRDEWRDRLEIRTEEGPPLQPD